MAIALTSTENMPYEEWLEWRKKGIGGSDASVVCGVNRWKSPVELWSDKIGQLPYQEAGEAAYWGKQLESLVKAEFTKRTGIEVVSVNKLLQSKEYPFMLANLDGVCRHPTYGTCVFEAKTANAFAQNDWNDSDVPIIYAIQVQHYMAVTGYMGAYIAVLIGGNTFKWTFLERDEELISALIQRENDFWEHVQSDIPPPLDGSEASARFLSKKFPNSAIRSKIKLPETAVALIQQYETVCEQLEQITERKQEAENLLKQMLGDNEAGIAGDRIITWKTVTQERLDSKTLKIEQPALYKKYANKSSHRRFSIKQAA